jgi:Uma2 family endonuclease
MRAVIPESLLAERRKLGHDRFDEMWEGELHMVPPPKYEHNRLAAWLVANWWATGRRTYLGITTETGLFDPEVADFSSYRQPDVVVARREHISDRGVEGVAELVVEIRSPDDEVYQKIPFYERVGVREVLVFEVDHSLRHWRRRGEALVERAPDRDGWVQLDSLPVRLHRDDRGGWHMAGPFGLTTLD